LLNIDQFSKDFY